MSEHTQTTPPHRHVTQIAHARHLAAHTGPMPAVTSTGRHRITSETPRYRTVTALIDQHKHGAR